MIKFRRFFPLLVLVCGTTAALAQNEPRKCPVLLTFDVEIEADIAALEKLNPPGSCSFFVTGEFAQAHPDLIAEWSHRHEIGCHTMTHPNLKTLDAATQFAEIRDSAEIVRKATGIFPLGFRAPFTLSRATKPERPSCSSASATNPPPGRSTIATAATRPCSNSRSPTDCSKSGVTRRR